MIKGKNWPIPDSKKMDGSVFALKNAHRLAKDASILLENERYSSALTLSTLALEEFGKHCMLADEIGGNYTVIDSKMWLYNYEDHPTKLKAIPKRLEKFNHKNQQDLKDELVKLKHYLASLASRKLQLLYVDWDGKNGDWFDCNDLPNIEKDAKEAILHVNSAITNYLSANGGDIDLILTTNSKKIELFHAGKIHCFCDVCSTLMMNESELVKHAKICNAAYVVGWFWNE